MLRRFLILSSAALLVACDSTEPNSLAGTWAATSFVITEPGEAPTDVLAAGGSLTITIASNNSTTGTLFVPASLAGGSDFTGSMAGTASRNGNSVTFDQTADTFVRNMTWTLAGNAMTTAAVVAGVTLNITLTRQ
jgi:hypothetical protein